MREVCNENRLDQHTVAEGDTANNFSEAEIIYDLLESSGEEDTSDGEEMPGPSQRSDEQNENAANIRIMQDPQIGPRPERWPANSARLLMGTGGKSGTSKTLRTGRKSTAARRDEP